jgi:hypothetical protein
MAGNGPKRSSKAQNSWFKTAHYGPKGVVMNKNDPKQLVTVQNNQKCS